MKSRKIIVFMAIALLVVFCLSSFAETKKLKRIGRYTLVRIKQGTEIYFFLSLNR